MPYLKTDWSTAKINADNLNKMQTQYAQAVADAIGCRDAGNREVRVEVVNDFPAHKMGRMIFHSVLKTFFFSNGSNWLIEPSRVSAGDAVRGDFVSSGNIQYTVPNVWQIVRRNYRNFTLNDGDTLSVEKPCHALIIAAWGDITINGTINLDYMGGYGASGNSVRWMDFPWVYLDLQGGIGGAGGDGSSGTGGKSDWGHNCAGGSRGGGGGGGGSAVYPGCDGAYYNTAMNFSSGLAAGGGDGTVGGSWGACDSGTYGVGGGGGVHVISSANGTYVTGGYSPNTMGGRAAHGGGGGLRVSGVTPAQSLAAGNAPTNPDWQGGGGVLILIALGNITIGSTGVILARGAPGGAGGNAYAGTFRQLAHGGGGGGGCGGGRVVVIRRGSYANTGTVTLTGGAGGAGGMDDSGFGPSEAGAAGSAGSITSHTIT